MSVLVGVGLLAAGQIQQGRIAAAQGRFQKEIGLRNQQIALANQRALERQAKAEQEAASLEESRIARREKIVKAAQRAIVGKSGVGLAGATLSVLADTAFQFSLERNLALRAGLLRARELTFRGGIFKFQGELAAARGRFASSFGAAQKRASFISAAGSVLSIAGQRGSTPQTQTFSTTPTRFGSSGSFITGGTFARNFPGLQ